MQIISEEETNSPGDEAVPKLHIMSSSAENPDPVTTTLTPPIDVPEIGCIDVMVLGTTNENITFVE